MPHVTRSLSAIIVLLACVGALQQGFGQQAADLTPQFAERRGRTSPIMVPRSQRPTAEVKKLVFSGSGSETKLFAAGLDKVVRCWSVDAGDVNDPRLQYDGEITWPIYRDLRGVILAMDAIFQGGRHRVAFGGVGAATSQVNLQYIAGIEPAEVLLADVRRQVVHQVAFTPDGTLLAVGHDAEPGEPAAFHVWDLASRPHQRHTLTSGLTKVRAISFSPDGASLAVAGREYKAGGIGQPGLVQIWSVARTSGRLSIRNAGRDHLLKGSVNTAVVGIDWLDDNQWVAGTVCGVTNAAQSKDLLHALAGRASKPGGNQAVAVNRTNRPLVLQIEGTPGRWTNQSALQPGKQATVPIDRQFRPLDHRGEPQTAAQIKLPAGWRYEFTPYVTAIQRLGRSGSGASAKFIVGMWNHLADPANKNWVEIQDASFQSVVQLEEPLFSGLVSAVAASPDGRLVAAAGLVKLERFDDTEVVQIRIWSAQTGKLLARIPDDLEDGALAVVAAVSPIATLEITAQDGKPHAVEYATGHMAPGQAPRPMNRQFVLGESRRRIHRLDRPRALPAAKDFRIADSKTAGKFELRGQGEFAKHVYGPFSKEDNAAYCGIPFSKDNKVFVAVGYDNGIKVWVYDAQRRTYQLSRSFYGHAGPATCIAISPDRNWLCSGSTDGTISAWSLDKLDAGDELGVRLARSGQSDLIVQSVVPGSIGHEAGFQPGMTIVQLKEGGVVVPQSLVATKLTRPIPGRELFFQVSYQGEPLTVQTPVSHDPVWTLYTFVDNKCIVATPQGFFDAQVSSANDLVLSRVGWHVNRGGGWGGRDKEQGVIRFPADMYKDQFLDNEIVAQAIATGKPVRVSDDAEQFPIQPTINFVGRTNQGAAFTRERGLPDILTDEQLPLTVRLQVAGAPKSELWVNGRRLTAAERNTAGEFLVTGEHLRAGRNHLVGVAVIQHGGKTFSNREDLPLVYRPATTRPSPRLFYLGVGVTELANTAAFADILVPLKHADNDAVQLGAALQQAIENRGGGELSIGQINSLTARQATKQNILSALAQLARQVRPDDVAVILLAGHGTHVDPFAAAAGGQQNAAGFFYIAYDTNQNFAQSAVTGAELDEQLSRLPCRCVLMLDTCHSEAAGSQRQLLDRAGLQFGPLVLSACETAQESKDFDGIARQGTGHGAFTAAVLESLTGAVTLKARNQSRKINADKNGDALLSLLELCQYCRDRTPQLVGELPGGRGLEQNPVVMTSLTFDPAEVLLCRAPQ